MPAVFEKLATSTLRERIVQEIREAILTGTLLEGERLVERKLASQFATSLTSVREALIQLESEGFVVKKPNSTTHVIKLSLEGAEKVFAARKVIETYTVEEAARLATSEQIQELEAMYLRMLETARSNRAREFILQDLKVHEKIWEIAGKISGVGVTTNRLTAVCLFGNSNSIPSAL
jgi:DNA-binding GntR family transcriptional regulator